MPFKETEDLCLYVGFFYHACSEIGRMAPKARRACQKVPALRAVGFGHESLEAVTGLIGVSGTGPGCPGALSH